MSLRSYKIAWRIAKVVHIKKRPSFESKRISTGCLEFYSTFSSLPMPLVLSVSSREYFQVSLLWVLLISKFDFWGIRFFALTSILPVSFRRNSAKIIRKKDKAKYESSLNLERRSNFGSYFITDFIKMYEGYKNAMLLEKSKFLKFHV